MRSCRPKRNFLVSSQAMSLRLVALWACAYTVKAGFFCKAAWCSDGSVCCKNDAYGLCGSPGTTCCFSPGGIINLCAPGSRCNQQTGNCYVGETEPEEEDEVDLGFYCKAASAARMTPMVCAAALEPPAASARGESSISA